MAKKEITLSTEDWRLAVDALGRSGVRDVAQAAKLQRLYLILDTRIRAAEREAEDTVTSSLSAAQRKPLIEAMERPQVPWLLSAMSRITGIMEALGWTPPEVDDEEEDES